MYNIRFFVLDGGISDGSKELANKIIGGYKNVSIEFIPMTDEIILEKIGGGHLE